MTFFAVARGRLGQLREPLRLNEDIRMCIRLGTWVEVGAWFVVGARRGIMAYRAERAAELEVLATRLRPAVRVNLDQAFVGADYH